MRILLAEDDEALADGLAELLRANGFAVDVAHDGEDACHLGDTESYDAALLDIGLPGADGLMVLARWRAAGHATPVLVLTARTSWSDKVAGFGAGADDYLTKPFLSHEVILRVRALIRRAKGYAATRIACGRLTYDTQSGLFGLDGEPLKLTAFESRVLAALMLRKEAVIPRAELADCVYEHDADVGFHSLEVIIGRLRRKIGADMIETVRGHGYRLTASGA